VSAAPGGARVLVVDDDPGVRYTLREVLVSDGVEVEEAAGGAEALARNFGGFLVLVARKRH